MQRYRVPGWIFCWLVAFKLCVESPVSIHATVEDRYGPIMESYRLGVLLT